MATLPENYKVFVNHLYESLVAQDDVNHFGKTVESRIMEFNPAKFEKPCA